MEKKQGINKTDLFNCVDILNELPAMIAWKDLNSIFIGGNKVATKFAGFKRPAQLEGITDYELKSKVAEYAESFIEQDKLVMEKKMPAEILGIHTYDDGNTRILYTTKKPIIDNNHNVIGLLYHSNIINDKLLINLSKQLSNIDNKFPTFNTTEQRCYYIGTDYSSFNLTNREHECLFYLIRGVTPAKVAIILNISKRTLETHIQHIKTKMKCHFLHEVIEKAIYCGGLYHLPKGLLKRDISIMI